MNSINGVLQRLYITSESDTQLVLQEFPVVDYVAAAALTLLTLILSIAGTWISAALAGGVALFFVLQARVRTIKFDLATDSMVITANTPISSQVLSSEDLAAIQRAYLFKADDGNSQIVLVRVDGEELGLSVYSQDSEMRPWKEPIVIAINKILHAARKNRTEQDSVADS